MSDDPADPVVAYLRRLDAKLDAVRKEFINTRFECVGRRGRVRVTEDPTIRGR